MVASFLPIGPRCRKCYYALEGLPHNVCPECGTTFDLGKPSTYTRKPPLVRRVYWLPGVMFATGVGLVLLLLIAYSHGLQVGAAIAGPIALGVLLGYGIKVHKVVVGLMVVGAAAGMVLGFFDGGISGLIFGSLFGQLIVLPILIGIWSGYVLRQSLKQAQFSQRLHLPALLIFLAMRVAGLAGARVTAATVKLTRDRSAVQRPTLWLENAETARTPVDA